MKSLFFLISLATIVFFGCKKDDNLPTSQFLFANAGTDTAVSLPLQGSGWYFRAILSGKASYSLSGKIISYSWTALYQDSFDFFIVSENADSSELFLMEWPDIQMPKSTSRRFRLEVRDDHQNVDDDTVTITIIRRFLAEYRDLSWDSTVGPLTYLNIKPKTDQIVNYQPFHMNYPITPDILNLCAFGNNCEDIQSWKIIPYVPYDSIKLTNKDLFYSNSTNNADDIDAGEAWVVIYATPQSGIDFNQKVSIGVYRIK